MARYTNEDKAYDLMESANVWLRAAREAGNNAAAEIADYAVSSAFNAGSAFSAAKLYGGGSSKGWAFRNKGARHMKQARKEIAQVREMLSEAAE